MRGDPRRALHPGRLLVCLGLSSVLIPAVVHFGLPELETYRGLSGIDSAVFVLLAVVLLRKCRADGDQVWAVACLAMLAGFAAKIGFELVTGATLFVDAAASRMLPVPLVHMVGAILGAVCGLLGGSTMRSPSCTAASRETMLAWQTANRPNTGDTPRGTIRSTS